MPKQKFVINSNEYICRAITREQLDDWPQPVPSSGRQRSLTRYLANSLILGGITDAFGGRKVGPESRPSIAKALEEGLLHVLFDSEATTQFGFIGPPRQKNTLTLPALDLGGGTEETTAIFGGCDTNGVNGTWSRQMFNDRPAKFFAGSSVTGMFIWEGTATTGYLNSHVDSYAWTGAGFSAMVQVADLSATENMGLDYEVHKGALYLLWTDARGTAANNRLYLSTTGNTWAAVASTVPTTIAHLEGSRLLDDGNTLWLIAQGSGKRIDLYKSTAANSAGAWTTVAASAVQGQVRSAFRYYDTTNTAQLMFMTEEAIYWIDQANNKAVRLYDLPYPGRAAVVWGKSLYIAMDAMNVVRYTQTESVRIITPISPGGGQAMPSGKDFREDSDGQVSAWSGQLGPIFVWSGDGPTSGTLNRTLALQWIENAAGEGWHLLFRRANTTNGAGYSSRAVFIDPVSGDLLWFGAAVASSNEKRNPDTVRILDVETDPRLLTANVYETAGFWQAPYIDADPVALSSTAFTMFGNTENLQASPAVSVAHKYGIDGAAATTALGSAQTANRYTLNFGTNGVGVNYTTISLYADYVGTATVGPVAYSYEFGYLKVPSVRWAYTVEIDIEATASHRGVDTAQVVGLLKTDLASKTKLTCSYAYESALYLLPLPRSQVQERLKGREDAGTDESLGFWTVVLAEV